MSLWQNKLVLFVGYNTGAPTFSRTTLSEMNFHFLLCFSTLVTVTVTSAGCSCGKCKIKSLWAQLEKGFFFTNQSFTKALKTINTEEKYEQEIIKLTLKMPSA